MATVKIVVDGEEREVAADSMLLAAVLDQGIHVPHYCWHPKLSVDGSCRMCQVEVEGAPKLVIACNTPVRDGMVVRTNSEKVTNARQGVMELLLVNHPIDCPICDKAGECLLQDYSYAYGSRQTRTDEPRRKLEKRREIGPRMILDQERCILCRRCVRFCREITGTNELGVFNMGDQSVLDVLPDAPLANDYSINTADICPVGALESKDFHHKLRVWFLKKTPSVCPSCSNGCNITIHHYREKVWRMMPRRNDSVNDTWMCDHGRLRYQQVNDETRLRAPLRRGAQGLGEVGWGEALEAVAVGLRTIIERHGASAVGLIASPHLTNEELFRLRQLALALGVENVDCAVETGSQDNFLIKAEKAANATGARRLGLQPQGAGLDLNGMLEAATTGKLRALYLCGDDVARVVDADLLDRALSGVEVLVVQDLFLSPLAERAHVVLPSLSWAEKTGSFTNFAGRVQQIHRAVAPPEGQPCDGEIFTRLLAAAGASPAGFDAAAVLGEIAEEMPAFAGLGFSKLGALGRNLPAAPEGAK